MFGKLFCWVLASLLLFYSNTNAGSYMFAGESTLNRITHPTNYTGSGGSITVTVGIDPTSAYASDMVIPVKNIITTINRLHVTTDNLIRGDNNTIPSNAYDFESVALHEMGHALGLSHPNLATESGLSGADQNYTKSTDGADDAYNLDDGPDDTRGSDDDIRGDDVNLNWFKIADNDPFTVADTIDQTTYSRDTADLPGGHTFVVNADRTVATLFGYPNTEAVMQQGTYNDEAQRTLAAEDVAAFRYAMAGVDEQAGTGDDYTFRLHYAGLTTSADIVIDFDNNQTGFATTWVGSTYVGPNHYAITSADIYFNDGINWFFNDELNMTSAEGIRLLLLGE